MGRLQNKVAVVTGAASGIGKAIALRFLAEGAKVVAADFNGAGLKTLASEVTGDLSTVQGDISLTDDANRLASAAKEAYGEVDILVNCAGIIDRFDLAKDVDDETWERVISVNLTGTMKVTRAFLQDFIPAGKGNIVTVSSVAGLCGARAAGAAYTASKWAVTGLVKNTAFGYAKSGIRCNGIGPGGVDTPIAANVDFAAFGPEMQGLLKIALDSNPRNGKPEEIANIALFLASEESSFINGQVIAADAGWSAF